MCIRDREVNEYLEELAFLAHTAQIQACLLYTSKVLIGIILGLLSFWLFGMTMLSIQAVVQKDLQIDRGALGLAITITSLVSGVTVVMFGNIADRYGRAKTLRWGFYAAIVGGILIATTPASSALTLPFC